MVLLQVHPAVSCSFSCYPVPTTDGTVLTANVQAEGSRFSAKNKFECAQSCFNNPNCVIFRYGVQVNFLQNYEIIGFRYLFEYRQPKSFIIMRMASSPYAIIDHVEHQLKVSPCSYLGK